MSGAVVARVVSMAKGPSGPTGKGSSSGHSAASSSRAPGIGARPFNPMPNSIRKLLDSIDSTKDELISEYDAHMKRLNLIKGEYLDLYEKANSGELNRLRELKAEADKQAADKRAEIIAAAAGKDKNALKEFLKGYGYIHVQSNLQTRVSKLFSKRNANNSINGLMAKFLSFYDAKIAEERKSEINNLNAQINAEWAKINAMKSEEGALFDRKYVAVINSNPWESECEPAGDLCTWAKKAADLCNQFLTRYTTIINNIKARGAALGFNHADISYRWNGETKEINAEPQYNEAIQQTAMFKKDKEAAEYALEDLIANTTKYGLYGGTRKASKRRNSSKSNRLNRRTKSNSR